MPYPGWIWIAAASALEAIFLAILGLADLRVRSVETIGLLLLSSVVYLISCYLVLQVRQDSPRLTRFILAAAALFRLTLWPLYPGLSDDVFRYRWEGRVYAAGVNPYLLRPAEPAATPFRDPTYPRIPGHDFRAVYGPLLELLQRGFYSAVSRFESDPWRQAFWFKLPGALFDLGSIALLAALLRAHGLPAARVLIYAWAPLAAVEFSANGHNDSVAVFLILAALLAARTGRHVLAFAALALATTAKIWPALLFPLFAGWTGTRLARWKPLWVVPLVLGATALPFASAGWREIEENLRFLSGFAGGWRNNDSLFGALLWISGDDLYLAKKLVFAVAGAAALIFTFLRWPLERAVLWTSAVLLMVSANCHAWYLTWLLPLLAIHPETPLLLWIGLSPLGHAPLATYPVTGVWEGSTPIRWLEYIPVYTLLAARRVIGIERPGKPSG